MLDLNLNADSPESTQYNDSYIDRQTSDGSGNRLDESGTSTSSVINADIDEDTCSTRDFTLSFDILKVGNEKERSFSVAGGVTKEFFPVSEGSSSKNCIDLSFNAGESPATVPTPVPVQVKKSRRGPRSRSSQYRGVTFYRRTGRWESHIWDCGKQVYLGGFDTAHAAARAYDRAAIKFRGVEADINFTLSDYEEDMKQVQSLSKEEFVQVLRRQSTGFARGSSKYRGVTLHKCGRWDARMGQFLGKKAYDNAAINSNEINNENTLDLSLGMSLSPGNGTKQKERLFHFPSNNTHQAKLGASLTVHSMDNEFMGRPVNAHRTYWNEAYPPVEGRATEDRSEGMMSNWGGWQRQGQTSSTMRQQPQQQGLYSVAAAASSGFSHFRQQPPNDNASSHAYFYPQP